MNVTSSSSGLKDKENDSLMSNSSLASNVERANTYIDKNSNLNIKLNFSRLGKIENKANIPVILQALEKI